MKNNSSAFGGTSFDYNEEGNIFVSKGLAKEKFDYSDGYEVERRIQKIVSSVSDKSVFSEEFAEHITDWPTEYHLSPRRGNILRSIDDIKAGSKVLELGCGCGAITRYLAEVGCAVDSVEGSNIRARIAGDRVRERSNSRVYNANFQNLDFEKDYDYVMLIGVLEYAPKFFDTENPTLNCLESAAGALKRNGKLIVAIDNQLGIKYFAGLPEDHHGKSYYGVEGRYADKQVVTQGKKELTKFLETAGFKDIGFSYPFPDYKLPQLVVTEAGMNSSALNVSDLIYSSLLRRNEREPVFDISSTCKVLEENGLIGELSNSFLVVACLDEKDITVDDNILAEIYTDNRKPVFNTKTRIEHKGKDIVVTKSSLLTNEDENDDFHRIGGVEKYIEGDLLEVKIFEHLKKSEHDRAYAWLLMWADYLESISTNGRLPGNFVDAIPKNFVVDNKGHLYLIDDEWFFDNYVDYLLVVFRGIRSIAKNKDARLYIEGVKEVDRVRAISRRLGLEESFSRYWDESVSYDRYLGDKVYAGGKWLVKYSPKNKYVQLSVKGKKIVKKIINKIRARK